MADEFETNDDDVLELTDAQPPEGEAAPEVDDAGDDDMVIEIEGDEAEEEPPLVKKLRHELRDRDRKIAELRPKEAEIVVGEKPTLESCEYDEDRRDAEYEAWRARKAAAEKQQADRETAAQSQAREYQDLEVKYRASAAKLAVKPDDFAAADAAVRAALPEQVILAVAKYLDDPAKVVAALGKYPARLDTIASEPDPLKQIFMIRDLAGAIKVTTRRAAPPPESETIQRGSAPLSATTVDKHAEKLLDAAAKSGSMNEYNRYMRDKRKAA